MTVAISIQSLVKFYRRFRALDHVSFEVQEGDFFGFLGPNGAGKTTTINVITGLANYQGGEVRVFGHDVRSEYRQTRALIGLVPQEFNFDPFLSVEQILMFEAGYFGFPWREARKRARELLKSFNLLKKRKDGYKRLSGGMKRRLLIARALMHHPKILILDEPTAGVDLELRHRLWDFLRELNRKGTTIFLTTHYIEEAERLCNRIGVIHEGKMIALDPTETLIRKMTADRVELSLNQTLDQLPPEFVPFGASLENHGTKIQFEEREGAVQKVLRGLHEKGIEIERIHVRRPTLEDAFLKLTQRKKDTVDPVIAPQGLSPALPAPARHLAGGGRRSSERNIMEGIAIRGTRLRVRHTSASAAKPRSRAGGAGATKQSPDPGLLRPFGPRNDEDEVSGL